MRKARSERGYFIIDAIGAVFLVAAMAVSFSYITMQLSYMKSLENIVTAEYMAREQLDKLCLEQNTSDLDVIIRTENGSDFQIISEQNSTGIPGLLSYKVDVQWHDRQGEQHFEVEKEVRELEK